MLITIRSIPWKVFHFTEANNGCRICHKQTILRCPICQITYCSNDCRKIDIRHKQLCHNLDYYIKLFSETQNRKLCYAIFVYISKQCLKFDEYEDVSPILKNIAESKFHFKDGKFYANSKPVIPYNDMSHPAFNYNMCNSCYGRIAYLLSKQIDERIISSEAIRLLTIVHGMGMDDTFTGTPKEFPEGTFFDDDGSLMKKVLSLRSIIDEDLKKNKNRVAYMMHMKPNSEEGLYLSECKHLTWENGTSEKNNRYTHHLFILRIGSKSCIVQSYPGYYGTAEWLDFGEKLERKEDMREPTLKDWRRPLLSEVKYRKILNNEELLALAGDIDGMCGEGNHDSIYSDITGILPDVGVDSYSVYYVKMDLEKV